MMIEDHIEFMEAIKFVLEPESNIDLVNHFSNAEQALRALEDNKLQNDIDIILLDLKLPGMSGLDAIEWIHKYNPTIKIIIFSQSDKEADILTAIQMGVSGYLLKSSTMDQLKQGIRTVNEGGAILDSELAKFILHIVQVKTKKVKKLPHLTKRELDVLNGIADGLLQKEIAEKLNLSIYTVTDYLKSIYEKLRAQNAPQAVAKAYKSGILNINKDT